MKIAIKGHALRGKEIIQIFKDLGTKGLVDHTGSHPDWVYLIDDSLCPNQLIVVTDITFLKEHGYKVYTLEEFEKEFPFKIGETVITTLNHVGTIIGIANSKYKVMFKKDSALITPRRLKPYKEMEERNITLTLEKAKEWYQKGGELKEIALQAFTEKELIALPRSWKEFCDQYSNINDTEYFIDNYSNIERLNDVVHNHCRLMNTDKNICPSQKSAEAHLAMIQLEQLRDCWRQGWKPTPGESHYVIKFGFRGLDVYCFYTVEFLSFPTYEMAKEFLECFRDLIEKAGDLI